VDDPTSDPGGPAASAALAQPARGYGPDPARADSWQIGPIIRGRNYSVGMPLQPSPERRGWSFDIPSPDVRAGHVHYLTFNAGSLAGKRRIVMRYRIDAPRGTRFVPREYPEEPAIMSMYFQRRGDSWSARGRYEHYRWYAAPHKVVQVAPGEHVVSIDLVPSEWISLAFRPGTENPDAFAEAIAQSDRVGFVFGAPLGRGHGAFATAPARFTVLSFEVI
jgi:hypothetical protein